MYYILSMNLWRGIFTSFAFLGTFTGTALAANDCTNPTYRQNNPSECYFFGGTTTILGGTSIIGGALVLVGMASSGGGDGGNANATYIQPTLSTAHLVGADVSSATLAGVMAAPTYNRNYDQYNSIRLAWSLARGYTGRGSEIAVLDAGSDTWHGATVASFASGAVAPDAVVREYKITDSNMRFIPYSQIGDTIAAASSANIYNASWSVGMRATELKSRAHLERITDVNFVNQISAAATERDAIFVWAAGNDGATQSSALSALPRVMPELRGHFINVVAYDDATGKLADYSNACGITRDWCITAPGTLNTKHSVAAGTSFAAPIVSAAIAVVRQAFPYMTASEITSLLFETARDLGAPGVDDIYGHGMLDLERATRPVGATLVPIDETMSQTTAATARVSGQIAHKIKSVNPEFAFFDGYGRAFAGDISDNISVQNPSMAWRHLHSDNTASAFNAGNITFGFRNADFLVMDGMLGTDGNNFMTFMGATNTWDFMNAEIFQNATIGFARPRTTENSLVTNISGLTTASFAIGARYNDWTFTATIPDTIVSGDMTMHIPVGRNADGVVMFRDYNIDMTSRPALEFQTKYKFMTFGVVDNPYGRDEVYVLGTWDIKF